MRRYHTNQTRQTSYDKQVQKAKEAEQDLLYIADQGRSFLEQHPEQCECPLCHTRFESWNLLYGATLKLESSQKKQLKEEARQIQQETASINAAYLRIRQRWLSMRENLLKRKTRFVHRLTMHFLLQNKTERVWKNKSKHSNKKNRTYIWMLLNLDGIGNSRLPSKRLRIRSLNKIKTGKEGKRCICAERIAGAASKEPSARKAECWMYSW